MKRFRLPLKNSFYKSLLGFRNIILELFIVFLGVYAAFLLSNHSENQRIKAQKKKVMSSLKQELEQMRAFYPGQQSYQLNVIKDWQKELNNGQMGDFYTWRYVQPQYNYTMVEYAINTRETGIVNFDLHNQLLKVYAGLKQIEYAEEKMTALAIAYQPLFIQEGESLSPAQKLIYDKNRFLFSKAITFSRDRANILGRIATKAEKALDIINQSFSKEELKKLEKELLIKTFIDIEDKIDKTVIRETVTKVFPKMLDEDINEIIEEVSKYRKLD